MQSLIILIVTILITIGSIESQQNPSCVVFDFNDPLILDRFENCTILPGIADYRPLITKSYNESFFQPYRPSSQKYLTAHASLNTMQCLRSKIAFKGNFSSMAFKMAYNLRNNEILHYNNFQLNVGSLWAQQLNSRSNGWELYEQYYNFSSVLLPVGNYKVSTWNYGKMNGN